jgi:eukaryotic-like serine/threonine-protein kinase
VTPPGHIGQYRILRKIGAGGMGMVFLGEHLLIQRRAAIKTLQPALSRHPEIVERFFNEARATSAIADPGIVQIFDFGYHVDGTAYIVMELLEGEGLADRLDRVGPLPIPNALRIARQVASSLAAAHAKAIVHRDLKPENIFLIHDTEAQGGERTKLLDFGICAVGGAPETAAPPETMIGTPVYMSPEQCRGGGEGDPRSDIYGLGCVLFQTLTGKAPFERDSLRAVIRAHLAEEPPLVSSLRPEVPPVVDELVRRCLAKAPEDRFASMTELGTAIEHALARLSGSEVPVVEAPPAVPLGTGFRSAYDANFVPHGLRIDEPTVSCAVAADRAPLRRAALAIALLGGAVLASLATRFTDGDEAIARATAASGVAPAAARLPAPVQVPRPATAAVPAPADAPAWPTPPAVEAAAPTAQPTPPEEAAAPTARPSPPPPGAAAPSRPARRNTARRAVSAPPSPAPAAPAAPTAPPAQQAEPRSPPPPSRAAPAPAPAQPAAEDLYDMR